MATLIETVYNDRNNTVDLLLKADGTAQALDTITRMLVVDQAGTFTIDSDVSPDAFDWDPGTTGKVLLSLGDESVVAGAYECWLILYDPTNTDGIVWGGFILVFKDSD